MKWDNVLLWGIWLLGLFATFIICNIDLTSYLVGTIYNSLAIAFIVTRKD